MCAATYLSSCFNDDDTVAVTQTLVTLDTRALPYRAPEASAFWIYATDPGGYILDIKDNVGLERITLTSTRKVEKFNLHIAIGGVNRTGKKWLDTHTYVDIEAGSTFDVRNSTDWSTSDDAGTVTFKINGYDGPQYGISFSNRGEYSYYTPKITGGSYNASIRMYQLPTEVLISTYREGIPVYTKIPDINEGDFLELDMNEDFTPFEHLRKLDFKGSNSGHVRGAYLRDDTNAPGLFFELIDSYHLQGTKHNTIDPIIGYVDGFDIYQMSVVNFQPSGSVTYIKQGNIEDSFETFTIPTFTYETLNTDLRHFAFQFSEDFTYYGAWFDDESPELYVSWRIHAPQGVEVNIGNVPVEIMEEFPMLRTERLKYRGCGLTKVVTGQSFKESIFRMGDDESLEFESYTYYPYPQ